MLAGTQAEAARASMTAINELTADAMLGTPDSDLWHNVDDLLHNVNDLMSRLDPEPSKAESEPSGHDEGHGGFFVHDAPGSQRVSSSEVPSAAKQHYYETQVSAPGIGPYRLKSKSNLNCTALCSSSAAHIGLMYIAVSIATHLFIGNNYSKSFSHKGRNTAIQPDNLCL